MARTVSLRLRGETPESLVFSRIRQHYGHWARPEAAKQDPESSDILVPIIAEIPVQITDRSRNDSRIAWIALGELGEARVTPDPLTISKIPSVTSFNKAARDRYREMTQSVEADMAAAAPREFGEFTLPQFFLHTLKLVIAELEANLDEGISETRLRKILKDTDQHRYLINADYARYAESVEGKRLVPTESFKLLRSQYDASLEYRKELFGMVFARNYDQITFRYRPLKSFVRSALTYYSACYEFGEVFGAEKADLVARHKTMYGASERNLSTFRNVHLPQLVEYDILELVDGRYYNGHEDIYQNFKERAQEKVPINARITVEA